MERIGARTAGEASSFSVSTRFPTAGSILSRMPRPKRLSSKQTRESGSSRRLYFRTEVKEFLGEQSKLNRIKIFNNQSGEEEEMPMDGVFIFIGLVPNTAFLIDGPLLLDPWGFVITGHSLVHDKDRPEGFENREPLLLGTSIPGIFAAGDVRDHSTKQVVSAAGEGSTAALEIREYLKMV